VRLKAQLPESVSSSLIPGNIAFHSARVAPILDSMRRRLAFLQSQQQQQSSTSPSAEAAEERESGLKRTMSSRSNSSRSSNSSNAALTAWSLPFISTVTGRVVTRVDAQYWCDNVRQPVLFHRAVENVFSNENAPEVVVEVGPHRTLVGPLMQVRWWR
jgi:acyl transferase domain-containing protein